MRHMNNAYLSSCINNPKTDRFCPVFRINDILMQAEPDEAKRKDILQFVPEKQFKYNYHPN